MRRRSPRTSLPSTTPRSRSRELADEGDAAVEPGLVVEHDEEIELDDVPDVEPAYELQPGEDTALHEAALADDPQEVDDELDEVVAASRRRARRPPTTPAMTAPTCNRPDRATKVGRPTGADGSCSGSCWSSACSTSAATS